MNFINSFQQGIIGNRHLALFIRNYAFKSDLKIKWKRPAKISSVLPEKSGDTSKLPEIDMKQYLPNYTNCIDELEDANDNVKSLFCLENNRRYLTSKVLRENLVKTVQRHKLDYGSMESTIAKMTSQIRRFQEYNQQFPRNKRLKVELKELIEKRKKFLKYLRRWDYKRFEWLLEKLDLVYKPSPAEFHWITRKDSLKKLTNLHCENVKQERLDEYRKELENHQIAFLEKKLKNLKFIRKEQQDCQVTITVAEDEIKQVENQLDELKAKLDVDKLRTVEN